MSAEIKRARHAPLDRVRARLVPRRRRSRPFAIRLRLGGAVSNRVPTPSTSRSTRRRTCRRRPCGRSASRSASSSSSSASSSTRCSSRRSAARSRSSSASSGRATRPPSSAASRSSSSRSGATLAAAERGRRRRDAARAPPATRSRFLEGATLGLGGVIGGLITVPVAGFAILPSFLGQKQHKVDLGPISTSRRPVVHRDLHDRPGRGRGLAADGVHPQQRPGRRYEQRRAVPSFTIISNRCAHLGCPVQANGPTGRVHRQADVHEHTLERPIHADPVDPAPATAARATAASTTPRATARPARRCARSTATRSRSTTAASILLSTYSVSHVVGTGATAKIYNYKVAGPGEHVDGPEQWFYPLQPPHH